VTHRRRAAQRHLRQSNLKGAITMPRFVKLILDDGRTIDGVLLDPTESGEGESKPLVYPLDRGDAKDAEQVDENTFKVA
jgi:dipeptidyl aminopeptidase/acylaminoacyl peptidase